MGSCYSKIEINAPIITVWRTIHDLSWASDVITEVAKVGNQNGNEVGAKRILNKLFHETLTEFDADTYTFS